MRLLKISGPHQRQQSNPEKKIDRFVVLVRGLRQDGMQIMTRFYEVQSLELAGKRLVRLHEDLHKGVPQRIPNWTRYDNFLRQEYFTSTAAEIAMTLSAKHGLKVTKNMVIGRANRLGLKKGYSNRKSKP